MDLNEKSEGYHTFKISNEKCILDFQWATQNYSEIYQTVISKQKW